MTGRMQGKTAFVTGGGSGIGRATALLLAAEGARVALADIDANTAEASAALVRAAGGEALAIGCDVTRGSDVAAAIAQTVATFGRLDAAVNNAGIEGAITPITELDESAWARTIDINLTGVFLCLKHELLALRAQGTAPGSGSIVNVSSVLGLVAFPASADYTSAKHGVLGLTKVAALEAAAQGVRVTAVLPGFAETPMAERGRANVGPEVYAAVEQMHALKRLGTAEEIAEAILWLLSDASSFVTGSSLLADGGFTAQ